MKPFRIFFSTLSLLILSSGLYAQFGIGAGLGYGTDVEKVNLFARASYQLNDSWRGAATFSSYLGIDDVLGIDANLWDINLDAHYFFANVSSFSIYALGGLNFTVFSLDSNLPGIDDTDTDVGLNIGAGSQFSLDENISPFGEAKLTIGDNTQFVISFGVLFRF